MNPAHYAKALMAAFLAAQVAFAAAILPDSPGETAVTLNEGILLAFAVILAGLGTYVIPNKSDDTGV